MRIFNADGSEVMMCGNASRCIGKYVYDNKLTQKKVITLETLSGIKVLKLHTENELVEEVTVDMDPHEIANVFGVEGILSFMEEETELDIFYGIPSSVPATRTEMETSGAEFGEKELRELLRDERVVCLGEVMNFKDL